MGKGDNMDGGGRRVYYDKSLLDAAESIFTARVLYRFATGRGGTVASVGVSDGCHLVLLIIAQQSHSCYRRIVYDILHCCTPNFTTV